MDAPAYLDACAVRHSNAYAVGPDCNASADSYTEDSPGAPHTHADRDSYGHSNADSNTDSNVYADAVRHASAYSGSNGHADPHSSPYCDGHKSSANPHANADTWKV